MIPAPKTWEEQIDDELYFLSQDGYGYEWRKQKAEDIKIIVRAILKGYSDQWIEEAATCIQNATSADREDNIRLRVEAATLRRCANALAPKAA